MKTTFDQLRETQPQFFSAAAITIPAATQQAMADMPGAQVNLALLHAETVTGYHGRTVQCLSDLLKK